MTTQGYQPQVNLTAVEPEAKEKWRLGGLVILAVIGAVALVFAYYRWFAEPQATSATNVISETAGDKPQHARGSSRRIASKHGSATDNEVTTDADLTLAPGIIQSAIRSPLAVEVISSDGHHQILDTRNDSIYLASHQDATETLSVMNLNAGSAGVMTDPVLAKQQTMEGAVVLLATIDKEGNIQKLQPISGPEILFAAAREAVKQWRFKPYYASGAPVDSETQITVKFAISAH
jgi:TonB family protein